MLPRLLIADDDVRLRTVISEELRDAGYEVAEAGNGSEAVEKLKRDEYDILLLDLNMPGMSGMDVLKVTGTFEVPPEVVIFTGNATVHAAVEAMKLGAYDFVTKPFKLEELKAVIGKAHEKRILLGENLLLKTQLKRQSAQKEIIVGSPLMREVLSTAARIAGSEFPILVYGESGVGKELIAVRLHEASERSEGPFIPINCAAIPETMIESELFGYEKGAFTGAHARKLGLLEIAHRGTIFLDEIGELPPALQVKLLRVIETKTFFRVGGIKEVKVDVKFVAATNKDLKAEAERGGFRSDLYYRLSAITLHIPPLRERKEDIPLLIGHFLRSNAAFRNRSFSPEAIRVLSAYHWPGNVRELQNVVHRTLLLSGNAEISPSDLPPDLRGKESTAGRTLADVERDHIVKVLHEVKGQKGKAAEILGIDPKTLYRKLTQYGTHEDQ